MRSIHNEHAEQFQEEVERGAYPELLEEWGMMPHAAEPSPRLKVAPEQPPIAMREHVDEVPDSRDGAGANGYIDRYRARRN